MKGLGGSLWPKGIRRHRLDHWPALTSGRSSAIAGAPSVTPMGPAWSARSSCASVRRRRRTIICRAFSRAKITGARAIRSLARPDLASLKTRAVRDGDHYVINGSKIWTTHAHNANRMFALVRTSEEPKKQDGISFILIMDTPGITVRPILTIGGDHETNQVFFDDVRVPVANRVGGKAGAGPTAKYLLEFERGGAMSSGRLREALRHVERLAGLPFEAIRPVRRSGDRAAPVAGGDRHRRARDDRTSHHVEPVDRSESRPCLVLSRQAAQQRDQAGDHDSRWRCSARMRWYGSPIAPSTRSTSRPVLDEDAMTVIPEYLNGRAYTMIFGGTSEVQRDIIARS